MNKQLNEFTNFVREQGVVGMAVGLAIGLQAAATVTAMVSYFIDPIVGFILGNTDLTSLTWTVISLDSGRDLVIGWGAILSAAIKLVAVAAVIFWVVKKAGLDKLDKKAK